MLVHSTSIVILFAIFILGGLAAPTLRIGRSTARLGSLASNAFPQEQTMHWWMNWTNANGGVNINGVAYDVQLVEYNDASDPVLAAILYEHLVEVDGVDALFSPFNSILTASVLNYLNKSNAVTPMVFAGGGSGNLYGAYSNAVGTIPPATKHALTCLNYLGQKARTIAIVYQGSDLFQTLQYNVVSGGAAAANMTVVANISFVTGTDNWSSVIATLKNVSADVLYLCMFTNDIVTFVPAMRKAGVYPPVVWYTSNAFALLAQLQLQPKGLGWTIDQFVSQGWWSANVSYTSDVGFKNSSEWLKEFNAYMKAYNYSVAADDLTAAAFAAGMVMTDAYQRASTTDKSAVSAALKTTDLQLYYGRLTFDSLGRTALPPICQQYINGSIRLLAPADVAEVPIIYPSTVRAPKGFFDLPKKKDNHNTRNILIIVACILAFLLIVGAVVYIVMRKNYHLIFIPKEGSQGNDEWGQDGGN